MAYTGPDGVRGGRGVPAGRGRLRHRAAGDGRVRGGAALRQNPATATARLIALTGYGQDEDRRRAREAGFDQHLTKPADPAALESLLAAG